MLIDQAHQFFRLFFGEFLAPDEGGDEFGQGTAKGLLHIAAALAGVEFFPVYNRGDHRIFIFKYTALAEPPEDCIGGGFFPVHHLGGKPNQFRRINRFMIPDQIGKFGFLFRQPVINQFPTSRRLPSVNLTVSLHLVNLSVKAI